MSKRQMECKHKALVLAMFHGGDKTELSYITVATTVGMFMRRGLSNCNGVTRGTHAFDGTLLFKC